MNDLISIVIPVYNVYDYLDECLKSVINQTYKNLEIIIINDGSSDNSLSICEKYAKKDKRIKLINQKNKGLSYSRNLGIKLSTGKYIGFVDSDDVLSERMYEILYSEIIKNDADFVISLFQEFTNEFIVQNKDYKSVVYSMDDFFKELMIGDKITNHVWNKLYKRELFDGVNFPLNKKYEDIGTLYKVGLKSKRIVFIDIVLYGYRKRDGSIVNNLKKQTLLDYIDMVNMRYVELSEKLPYLKDYLDMNRINFVTRYFLEIVRTKNEEYLKDKKIKTILDRELKYSKKIVSKNTIKLSSMRENIANFILMFSLKCFLVVMRIFYKLK